MGYSINGIPVTRTEYEFAMKENFGAEFHSTERVSYMLIKTSVTPDDNSKRIYDRNLDDLITKVRKK